MAHAAVHRCSPVTLAAAAQSFTSRPDAAQRATWIRLAYPIAIRTIEEGCAGRKPADPDELTLDFLNRRLLDPGTVEKISKADSPISYLETTARNFVRNALREATVGKVFCADTEGLADLEHDDGAMDGEGEEHRDDEMFEARAKVKTSILNEIARMSTRDRVLLVASYVGAEMLSVADREAIALKRGVTLEELNNEIAAETARCAERRQMCSTKLERLQVRLDRVCERNERAFQAFRLVPSPENSAEVTRQNHLVQRLWARREKLLTHLADPFCGSPNRRAIALLIGEVPPGGDLDTATNSAWKRARRLASELAKKR